MHPFIEIVPSGIDDKLRRVKPKDEPVLMQVHSDMTDDHRFGEQWVVVTDQRVLLVPAYGDNGTVDIPIAEVADAKVEALVGGGCLEIKRKDGAPAYVAYSGSRAPQFAEVAAGIKQLSQGETLTLPEEIEKTRCETCGRLLPEKDGICAACIKRGATLRRIFSYLSPYRGRTITMIMITLAGTLLGLLPPVITQRIIDDVLTPRTDLPLLIWLVAGLFGIQALIWWARVVRGWLSVWLGACATADVRSQLYRHMQFMPIRFYDKRKVGTLISRITNDTDRLEMLMMFGLPHIFTDGMMVLGILGLLIVMNWQLAMYVLLPIPLIAVASVLIWNRLRQNYSRWLAKWARLSSHLNESITGIRVVKAFAQEKREGHRFEKRNEELTDVVVIADRTWFAFFTTTNFLMSFGAFFVWYFGGRQILDGTLTLGVLMAFVSYLWMLYEPLQWLGEMNSFVSRAFAAAERIFEVLDKHPEPFEAPDAIPMPVMEGAVAFKDMTFGYDRAKPVLKNINLDVKAGEMIGLVGRSGVGKSTMINLICRFYDPDRGDISIDGTTMNQIRLEDLRRHIGMVHQESFLFNGTIADNIGYSKPGATLDEIIRAAMAAEAHEFIVAKPDGYNTMVGERGNKLSGGEKQRLSIARAILHDPRILILDEATSSLDTQTEKKIQDAIARLVKGRTTFAIAHRLSTLRTADRLVVIDDGKIAEVGTHEELMYKRGLFYNLVKTQQETTAVMAVGGDL